MAQKSKSDELKSSSRDDAALRKEVADALGLPPDDPQVTATLDNLAGSDVIQGMRDAAARALDAAAAAQPEPPGSSAAATGPATVVPAAPADNPYKGLTVGEILQRPWKWSTSEKGSDGLTTTVDHEYVPDPAGPIGTKIETTTREIPGVLKIVEIAVNAPGQPATLYTQTYRDGDLVSSNKVSSDNVFGAPVTDANGRPAAPDFRADIPGGRSSDGGSTPTDATPDDKGSQIPTPDTLGAGTSRVFVDGAFVYTEYDNGDGTFTWTRYDSRDGTTSSATTRGLVGGASAAAGLDYSGQPTTGGGDEQGDPRPTQDGADDPDAGASGDEGGGGDEQGDPSPAQDGADDPDAGASGDEGGGGDETGDPAGADGQGGGGGDDGDDTEYLTDDGYSSAGPALEVDRSAPGPPRVSGERSVVADSDGGGHRSGASEGGEGVYKIPEGTDLSALEMRLARLSGDHGDPNDPNAIEGPAPDPTRQPGYGNTDPVGDPDVAMLSTGEGHLGFTPLGGDFGNPVDPNTSEAPAGEGIHTGGPDPTTSLTVGAAQAVVHEPAAAAAAPSAAGFIGVDAGGHDAPAAFTGADVGADVEADAGGHDSPTASIAPDVGADVGAEVAGDAPTISAEGPGDFSGPPPGGEAADVGASADFDDPNDPDG